MLYTYIKLVLLILLALTQVSCGFRPAYKVNNINLESLAQIEVTPVSNIEGASFYEHIKSIFPHQKSSKYILNTTIGFARSYNIIQSNSDILRETQNITVSYQLVDKQSLKVLTQGSFTKMSSYSVNFSLYSNAILRQESAVILAENAAEEIRNRLIMFFSTAT